MLGDLGEGGGLRVEIGGYGQADVGRREQGQRRTDTHGFRHYGLDSRAVHSLARHSLACRSPNSASDHLALVRTPRPAAAFADGRLLVQHICPRKALRTAISSRESWARWFCRVGKISLNTEYKA